MTFVPSFRALSSVMSRWRTASTALADASPPCNHANSFRSSSICAASRGEPSASRRVRSRNSKPPLAHQWPGPRGGVCAPGRRTSRKSIHARTACERFWRTHPRPAPSHVPWRCPRRDTFLILTDGSRFLRRTGFPRPTSQRYSKPRQRVGTPAAELHHRAGQDTEGSNFSAWERFRTA